MGERIAELAGKQTGGLEAGWHVGKHTGTWAVELAGWLVGSPMERWVACQQTIRHDQMDNLDGYHGG